MERSMNGRSLPLEGCEMRAFAAHIERRKLASPIVEPI
jgi:hypothetical protein